MSAPEPRASRPLRLELSGPGGPGIAARGEAFVPLDDHALARLAAAARDGTVAGGEALKAPRVWRLGPWVFKFYARRRRSPLRAHPALRSARAHERIRPVDSPQPIAALELPRGGAFDGLLVTRFVAGRGLEDVWSSPRHPPEGRDELARFLALLSTGRVWHGDLHPGNLLWDGERWWLLDLDGLRSGPLRRLDPRREREAWARLHFNLRLDPEFAAVHRAALGYLGRADRHGSEWARIDVRAREIAASRGPDPWPGRGPA